jgi:hypothetical protein
MKIGKKKKVGRCGRKRNNETYYEKLKVNGLSKCKYIGNKDKNRS